MGLVRSTVSFFTHIAQLLVLIGALNWGLFGLTRTDAVVVIFPKQFVRTVHIAVGVAALFLILQRFI
jgi:uncharacterized membrane protein YuzA (DUF378 family)